MGKYHFLKRPFLEATLISTFILGLFYYWFGIANRHIIFLYDHVTVGIPYTLPFDEMTSSRYWMSGLVAAGAVMVIYTAVYWVLGRTAVWHKTQFIPSRWQHVWLLSAIPILIGILMITMNANSPTLPFSLAMACVTAVLLGVAIALLPAKWAAEQPSNLAWLIADGIGLMPVLLLLRAIELPNRGLSITPAIAWLGAIGGVMAGIFWLAGMSILRIWRNKPMTDAGALIIAGVALSYLIMPLLHHLLGVPPAFRYISAASNFFAFRVDVQFIAVVTAVGTAIGVTTVRRRSNLQT